MHAYLQETERAIQLAAEKFSRERLLPGYMARESGETSFDRDLVREMGSMGFLGSEAPERWGGLGLNSIAAGVICEAIGYGDFNYSYLPLAASLAIAVLDRHANPAVAQEWIPKIIAGEALVPVALTEPSGGSDAARLKLRAVKAEGGWRVSGEKASISMGAQADALLVFARTGKPEDGARGISAFLVPAASEGITRTVYRDLGSKVIGRSSIFFDEVYVPDELMLGDEGRGFAQVMQGFDYSRALLGLQCVGAAQASVDETWSYMTTREAFGKPISAFQGVTFPIAEGDTMLCAIRALCYQTLKLRDDGLPHTAEAAMCKWLGPKTAVEIIHQCLLTHGHYGWSMDYPHQQRMRDVMGIEIGDGTAQIMKMIIARERLKALR
ncbi:acyl-CoA dehydrogenase family protein [Sphingomonas oryzagri]